MKCNSGLMVAGAVASTFIVCSAFNVHAEETRTSRFVANGPIVILANWTCWFGGSCKYAPCHMNVVQKPTLGTVAPAVHHGVLPPEAGSCAGKPAPLLNITYTPRAEAHGSDEVVLRSMSENGLRHTLNIHVDIP
jgi:hypothetical protein